MILYLGTNKLLIISRSLQYNVFNNAKKLPIESRFVSMLFSLSLRYFFLITRPQERGGEDQQTLKFLILNFPKNTLSPKKTKIDFDDYVTAVDLTLKVFGTLLITFE